MVNVRDAFTRETGMVTVVGSLQTQRRFYRDLACMLWALFERANEHGVVDASKRLALLKMITIDDNPQRVLGLIRPLVREVVDQTRHLKSELGSWQDSCERIGLEATCQHVWFTLRVYMQSLEGLTRMLMLPTWAEYGFPSIQVGHKLASSLLVTRISEEVLDGMRLPFPVFEIELPTGMFETEHHDEERGFHGPTPLGVMLCGTFEGAFEGGVTQGYALLASAQTCGVWNVKHSIKELGDIVDFAPSILNDPLPDPRLKDLRVDIEVTDQDTRTVTMLARLFANTALMMSASGNYRAIGKGHGRPTPASTPAGRRRQLPFPINRVFQLTVPVRHDFREVVGDYMRGGGKPPTVQGVVTGHWKMQPHGPGRQQRRPQFIEPYWRGPEDAPIAVRPHKLK